MTKVCRWEILERAAGDWSTSIWAFGGVASAVWYQTRRIRANWYLTVSAFLPFFQCKFIFCFLSFPISFLSLSYHVNEMNDRSTLSFFVFAKTQELIKQTFSRINILLFDHKNEKLAVPPFLLFQVFRLNSIFFECQNIRSRSFITK